MKVSLGWLAEFVSIPWSARELGDRLTMSGFELESLAAAAPEFGDVVVASIVSVQPVPYSDRLQVCRVTVRADDAVGELQVVCGAANARAGLRTALARVGATLPRDVVIKSARVRGVESQGMLCSAQELGLLDSSDGILELPADSPLGMPLRQYLRADDSIIELNVTPNRGDAMSMVGVAREVAAMQGFALLAPVQAAVTSAATDVKYTVTRREVAACPRFVSRVIRRVSNRGATPIEIRERLRRAGVRSISPIVDVTNYVLLEYGQPMHAYDLAKLQGPIEVRLARPREPFTLLDGRDVELDPDMLVIADAAGPIGLAGVMGGARTAVSAATTDVLFEVAYFSPQAIAGRGRRLGLVTDASQRFERGVDPAGQLRATERATQLLLAITGGEAGPVQIDASVDHLPQRKPISLRRARLAMLLGRSVADAQVVKTLESLGMAVMAVADGWQVQAPSWRFDLSIEADLIEEVARVVGYDQFEEASPRGARALGQLPEAASSEREALQLLAARGYQEVITFAFVDPALQTQLFPDLAAPVLANPIASDLAAMRVSLWPGLLAVARENQRRQHERVRIVELGAGFRKSGATVTETELISGLGVGPRLPEQWGSGPGATVDFFDTKADVMALLASTGDLAGFEFRPASVACLHPGRTAEILRHGRRVGLVGELHPRLARELDITGSPILFELEIQPALKRRLAAFAEISRFPSVRRDLAVVVDENVALSALRERVVLSASSLLREFLVFDLYRGPGIETGRKSIALGLIFQEKTRTLTDADADNAMAAIRADLSAALGATFRE
ncbi:MAG: phenylalanine--tRNA ligase subunit beta [Proteobacteria bacterium]|nr:phenylalanine--tRNA ligase subunit beta [Pseudomonadota bacterium]